MSKKYPKFDGARASELLDTLSGRGPDLEEVKADPNTALDVVAAVVDVLETLPDVTHMQRRIAFELFRGKLPVEVAATVGCSAAYVRALMPDPRITELVKIFRGGKIYDFAEDIGARDILKRASVRAAEVLAEKMNFAVDEGTQLRAAVEVLKATGEIGGDGRMQTEIVIEAGVTRIFQKVMDEEAEDEEIQEAEIIEEDTEDV